MIDACEKLSLVDQLEDCRASIVNATAIDFVVLKFNCENPFLLLSVVSVVLP